MNGAKSSEQKMWSPKVIARSRRSKFEDEVVAKDDCSIIGDNGDEAESEDEVATEDDCSVIEDDEDEAEVVR